MTLNEYYNLVVPFRKKTATPDYVVLGLIGEVGELYNKLGKEIRDDMEFPQEDVEKEIGDIFWFLVMLTKDFGFDPDHILQQNVDKLAARFNNNTISGSGDNR